MLNGPPPESMTLVHREYEVQRYDDVMTVARHVLGSADIDVVRETVGDEFVVHMRTFMLAKKHEDSWVNGMWSCVAPGVRNNIKAWLNTQWPFSRGRRIRLHVKWLGGNEVVNRTITYVCPHVEIPDPRRAHQHFAFLDSEPHR